MSNLYHVDDDIYIKFNKDGTSLIVYEFEDDLKLNVKILEENEVILKPISNYIRKISNERASEIINSRR